MKVGDRFIRYSKKQEPAVMGTVEKRWITHSYDLINRVRIEKPMIQSTLGQVFEENECFVIQGEISFRFWLALKKIFKKKAES